MYQIEDIIRKDKLVSKHRNPQERLRKFIVNCRWFTRKVYSYTSMAGLE